MKKSKGESAKGKRDEGGGEVIRCRGETRGGRVGVKGGGLSCPK